MQDLMEAVSLDGGLRGIGASGVKLDTIFGVGQVMTNLSCRLKPFHTGHSDLSFMVFDQLSCPWSTSPARTSVLSLKQIVRTLMSLTNSFEIVGTLLTLANC